MVRILASDFNELDLAPGQEFQIEMENPIFDSCHLPGAFSTRISFPPSPTNREKFGYTPILMRPPSNLRLGASIWVGGVPVMYGDLVYDGIEDGDLQYTFTSKIPDLEAKIWDQNLLEFTTDNLPAERPDLFRTPLVIRKSNVAMQPYLNGSVDENLWVKYWNYKTEGKSYDYQSFLPAIPVSAIISWLGLETPSDLQFLLNSICILGRYHEFAVSDLVAGSGSTRWRDSAGSRTSTTRPRVSRRETSYVDPAQDSASGRGGSSIRTSKVTDLATFLPDITFSDLLKGVGSMLCCSFYIEGKTLRMVRNADVLEATPLDWRGKISDRFSSETVAAVTYKLGYSDSDGIKYPENLDPRSTHHVDAGAGGTFDPGIILRSVAPTGLYSVVRDAATGDIYSGRSYEFGADASGKPSGYSAPTMYDCDVIYQNAKSVTLEVDDEEAGTFDNSCNFRLVRCVPEKIFPQSGAGTWPSDSSAAYRMVAITDPLSVSETRDSEVYVGIIDNLYCQMTGHDKWTPMETEIALLGCNSLTPEKLWDAHHQAYAEWMTRRRQMVKAGVRLTPSELQAFRFYHPVYFQGRKWIVKRLSVTVVSGSDNLDATCDCVES